MIILRVFAAKTIPRRISQLPTMEPTSSPNLVRIVLWVSWGIDGETLGPKMGPGSKRTTQTNSLLVPCGIHFNESSRQRFRNIELWCYCFLVPSLATFFPERLGNGDDHALGECSWNVAKFVADAQSPHRDKSHNGDGPELQFGWLLEHCCGFRNWFGVDFGRGGNWSLSELTLFRLTAPCTGMAFGESDHQQHTVKHHVNLEKA